MLSNPSGRTRPEPGARARLGGRGRRLLDYKHKGGTSRGSHPGVSESRSAAVPAASGPPASTARATAAAPSAVMTIV
ncbi:hypothetical protein SAT01_10990 [Sinomonas atrocyanea]|nr:hypothetical protein SAT01_10990 [Sinomonas atrocyanea]